MPKGFLQPWANLAICKKEFFPFVTDWNKDVEKYFADFSQKVAIFNTCGEKARKVRYPLAKKVLWFIISSKEK